MRHFLSSHCDKCEALAVSTGGYPKSHSLSLHHRRVTLGSTVAWGSEDSYNLMWDTAMQRIPYQYAIKHDKKMKKDTEINRVYHV